MRRAIIRIILPYLLFGGLWILLSDSLLAVLVSDPVQRTHWSIYKGWTFILVTSLLLYLLLKLELLARRAAEEALRRSQEELQASEEKYRVVADYTYDWETWIGVDGRFVYISPSCKRITGYAPGDFVNDPALYARIVHPDDREIFARHLREMHTENAPDRHAEFVCVEFRIITRDGEARWLEHLCGNIFASDGRWLGQRSNNRDITDRKHAEEALRRSQEELEQRVELRTHELKQTNEQLEAEVEERRRTEALLTLRSQELARSNAELEQFAYVASHDLQEPLRMVASFMQLLETRYKDKLDSDAREFIGFAVDGAKRMRCLIDDLLSYSRVATRGQAFQPTDCETVFATVMGNLTIAIRECDARITHDPLPTVAGDPTQLAQLFQNLIANAIKFRRDAAPEVHIHAETREDGWCISVRDNGIGIEPRHFSRIFLLFQRLHSRSAYPGTGIGLAVCKKIVERHGGTIWVESEPGEGTTFYFTLPAKAEATP